MNGIGLAVVAMGLQMTFKSEQYIIVILSIVIGAVIGEWIDLEKHLNTLGNWIESKMKPTRGDVDFTRICDGNPYFLCGFYGNPRCFR